MTVDVLFAGVAVSDLDAAIAWYERLLGRPADIVVNDDEVMWQVVEAGWMYVVRDRGRAGRALVTIAVPDLAGAIGEIEDRGLTAGPVEAVGSAGTKAVLADPDGNAIAFVQVNRT